MGTASHLCLKLIAISLLLGPGLSQAAPAKPREVVPRGQLDPEERTYTSIFEKYSPSVVSVVNKGVVSGFFGLNVYEVEQGSGSGFFWDREGHIVSNYHVVHGADDVMVILSDGTELDAEIVGLDPDHDIAVLKVDPGVRKIRPAPLGRSSELKVGQRVLAIGNPFGLKSSMSLGIVSSLGRNIEAMSGVTIVDVIQTDAAINPGNSGGPLLDSAGRLIGINTAIISPTGASVGIGFAVPVDAVNRIVPDLINFGHVKRPGLGVSLLSDEQARYFGIEGVVIRKVFAGSPADEAGLRGLIYRRGEYYLGDVIIGVDKKVVRTQGDLRDALLKYKEGDKVDLHIIRGRRSLVVEVELQKL